jgi:hypothetical protein
MKRLLALVALLASSLVHAGAPVATTILTDRVPPYLVPSTGTPVPVGDSATASVVLSKGTGSAARVVLINLLPGSDFLVTGGTCVPNVTTLINPTDSCTIDLQFAPTSGGVRSGTLQVDCTPVVVVGGIAINCDLDLGTIASIALSGLGGLLTSSVPVPTLGRHEVTGLALLLFALALWSLRRKP